MANTKNAPHLPQLPRNFSKRLRTGALQSFFVFYSVYHNFLYTVKLPQKYTERMSLCLFFCGIVFLSKKIAGAKDEKGGHQKPSDWNKAA